MPAPPAGKPAEKKPKGAVALLVGGAEPSMGESMGEPAPETDHGFRAVAKAFGIPAEREASAQAALKQYIQACMRSSETEEEY